MRAKGLLTLRQYCIGSMLVIVLGYASEGMLYLAVDAFWDGMRSHPRYADLLRRMGLPQ